MATDEVRGKRERKTENELSVCNNRLQEMRGSAAAMREFLQSAGSPEGS